LFEELSGSLILAQIFQRIMQSGFHSAKGNAHGFGNLNEA
jgi:hypothetical protein